MAITGSLISLDDVYRARERIGDRLHRTPMLSSATLSKQVGADVRFKAELFQRTGSFKPRGVLNKLSTLRVSEAEADDRILPGRVLITPGGYHLLVRREGANLVVELVPRVPEDMYVPSADRMMISVAEACGLAALGVVLTGMGRDGAEGAVAIKKQGGQCLAESEESAVVFGMPQEAIRTGAIDKVLPLGMMAEEILRRCRCIRSGLS